MRLLDKLQLEVTAFRTHLTAHSVVVYIICTEYRSSIARSERLKLLEDTQELWSDLREVEHSIYIDNRCLHLWYDGS